MVDLGNRHGAERIAQRRVRQRIKGTIRKLGGAILKLVKFEVEAPSCHQFSMRSDFPNPPFMENDDPVGVPDC